MTMTLTARQVDSFRRAHSARRHASGVWIGMQLYDAAPPTAGVDDAPGLVFGGSQYSVATVSGTTVRQRQVMLRLARHYGHAWAQCDEAAWNDHALAILPFPARGWIVEPLPPWPEWTAPDKCVQWWVNEVGAVRYEAPACSETRLESVGTILMGIIPFGGAAVHARGFRRPMARPYVAAANLAWALAAEDAS